MKHSHMYGIQITQLRHDIFCGTYGNVYIVDCEPTTTPTGRFYSADKRIRAMRMPQNTNYHHQLTSITVASTSSAPQATETVVQQLEEPSDEESEQSGYYRRNQYYEEPLYEDEDPNYQDYQEQYEEDSVDEYEEPFHDDRHPVTVRGQ